MVWDVHTHLHGVEGRTPKEKMAQLFRFADRMGIERIARAGTVYFEFAMLEGVGGVGRLMSAVGLDRVLFGSHFPLFHLESAVLKIKEADLKDEQLEAIHEKNARRVLA